MAAEAANIWAGRSEKRQRRCVDGAQRRVWEMTNPLSNGNLPYAGPRLKDLPSLSAA
jgi:hypothetical protein